MEEKDINSTSSEGLMLGALYTEPNLILEFDEKLNPPEKYFNNKVMLYFYNLLRQLCLIKKHVTVDETKIGIYLEENPEYKEEYKKYKGYNLIQRFKDKVDMEEVGQYYETLVKYAIVRELQKQKFPVDNIIEKIDELKPENIIEAFEYKLNQIEISIKGISDSIILGLDIDEVYEDWKVNPELGEPLPFPILSGLLRGFRLKTFNILGTWSGFGKSRITSRVITDFAIARQIPLLVLVNEQEKSEWDAMMLSSVVNNMFAPKTGIYVEETAILTGSCTEKQDEICKKAIKFIKENSKIHFQEVESWDFNNLKRVLRKNKLRGIDYWILDTFKPMRFAKMKGLAQWEMFVETARVLKEVCGSKRKGGLEMGGWATIQLTDQSQMDSMMLNSLSIANGKHLKHEADGLMLMKPIKYKEKQNYSYIGLDSIGEPIRLDINKEYYIMVIDKNRGGKDKVELIFEVDKGKNIWKELGYAKFMKG